jgi:predicted FMN-binding regulatory protein PaiB
MYRSKLYPADDKAVADFIAGQRHGHLIATAPGGYPQVSILPFAKRGDEIELHCVQADETFAAVRANPRVTFFVSDFLAFSRHDWVNPADAGRATLNFRAVSFECEATTSTDPDEVAATLRGLLSAYEPGASFEPLANGDYYGPRLQRLAVVRLKVLHTEAKFKLGPADTVKVKRGVIDHLRERNEPGDPRAADVIEASLPAGE